MSLEEGQVNKSDKSILDAFLTHICAFGFEGSADGSVSVHGGDTEQERAEVRPEHLEELDSAAQQVPAQEQGRGQRPGDLGEQRQQRGQQISHGEVNQEHVHTRYLQREKES